MSGRGLDARSVNVGDAVTSYVLTLSLQRMIMEAAVNRDFTPFHSNTAAGQLAGARDAFANVTFIETILEAALRTWAGPTPRLRAIEYAMVDFSCAGDTLTVSGAVTAVSGALIEVEIRIDGANGRTVNASATLQWPSA